jgi:hypothetical protein
MMAGGGAYDFRELAVKHRIVVHRGDDVIDVYLPRGRRRAVVRHRNDCAPRRFPLLHQLLGDLNPKPLLTTNTSEANRVNASRIKVRATIKPHPPTTTTTTK